jgi:hypothetical protein
VVKNLDGDGDAGEALFEFSTLKGGAAKNKAEPAENSTPVPAPTPTEGRWKWKGRWGS